MLRFIKKLFNTETNQQSQMYNFLDVEYSEVRDNYPSVMESIRSGNEGVDGIILRNVLTEQELKMIVEDLNALADKETYVDDGLKTYPMAFSQVYQESKGSEGSMSNIFKRIEKVWVEIEELFRVPLVAKLNEALGSLSSSYKIEVAPGADGKGIYNPATFRRLKPNSGRLVPHCGRYFQKEFPFLYTHLSDTSIMEEQMSFFLTIQAAEEDGALVLYDVEWSEAEIRPEHDLLVMKDGSKRNFNNPNDFKTQSFKPNAGDLLVFAGGRIWHKVSTVKGERERITLGGFLLPSKDGKKICNWS